MAEGGEGLRVTGLAGHRPGRQTGSRVVAHRTVLPLAVACIARNLIPFPLRINRHADWSLVAPNDSTKLRMAARDIVSRLQFL
jgi:hypothetical protein